jgi:hypothetical protein
LDEEGGPLCLQPLSLIRQTQLIDLLNDGLNPSNDGFNVSFEFRVFSQEPAQDGPRLRLPTVLQGIQEGELPNFVS